MPPIKGANAVAKNGRFLPYLRAFANEYCHQYNMNTRTMENILNNKYFVYQDIYNRCFNVSSI